MKCIYCGNDRKIIYKDFHCEQDNIKYIIPNIKHLICVNCKKEFFDMETSDLIDKKLNELKNQKQIKTC